MRSPVLRHRAASRMLYAVAATAALAAALYLSRRECGYGGGMPGWYRDCRCLGIERLEYDMTAVDGRRRTTCIGFVVARSCHEFVGGPPVPCDAIPAR